MAKNRNQEISQETQDEALQITKKIKKPGQSKEQTRLIALGIQKGIAEYKKSAKAKQRQADKAKKRRSKTAQQAEQQLPELPAEKPRNSAILPWGLLIASWLGFAAYIFSQL